MFYTSWIEINFDNTYENKFIFLVGLIYIYDDKMFKLFMWNTIVAILKFFEIGS